MFCPKCQTEYQDHVQLCADCHVPLVSKDNPLLKKQQEINTDDLELVLVFSTQDPGIVALAKSMLDDTGIPAMVRNEGLQDLFGFGRVNFNPVSGDVDFFVNSEDKEAASELLATITSETNT